MKHKSSTFALSNVGLLAGLVLCATSGLGQSLSGIPEPGLTLYGEVRNVAGGGNVRVTTGTLRWTVTPVVGAPVTVETQLRNINDQFSYVMRVPYETVLPGFTLSANTLALSQGPTNYTRTAKVNDTAATLVPPAVGTFSFSAQQRGRLGRVDLQVVLIEADRDGDGMPDAWELAFNLNPDFAGDAESDTDGDGLKAYAEYRAGTNPNDAQSVFEFINVQKHATAGLVIEWSSIAGKAYVLERSTDLVTGFAPVQPSISATAPKNTYHDATATGSNLYFYRLRVQ